MKKSIAVITAVFVLTISGMAFAQMMDKDKDTKGDKAGMMEGKGGMMGMMGAKGMMMKCMGMMQQMHSNMVATPDRRLYLACSGVNKVAVVDLNK